MTITGYRQRVGVGTIAPIGNCTIQQDNYLKGLTYDEHHKQHCESTSGITRDIGLPQTELPTALLFFNVGVEIGQILFVLALVIAFLALRPVLVRLLRSAKDNEVHWSSLTVPASYVIGSIASYWMISRVGTFWA